MKELEYRAITKEDPKNELTHWKYIKRERKNGKWRYYYDDTDKQLEKLYDQYEDVLTTTKYDYDRLSDEDKKKWDKADDEYNTKRKKLQEGFSLDDIVEKTIAGEFGNGSDRKERLGDSYDDVQKRVNEMIKKSSSITTYSKSSIEKGSNYVKNTLNK